MLLPACAKARGISPSTLLMTPGCRPEDICHCVSLEEERTGRPWAPPPPPQLGTPLSKGDQGRRAHLPLRAVLGQREFSKGRVHRLVLRAGQECGLLASRTRGFCYMRPRVRPRSLRFLTSAWRRSRAKWEVQWKLWFLSPELAGRAWPGSVPGGRWPVSGVEHSLPAAVRRTLLETLGWLGRRRVWRACVCARACVHARVHLPAPVSALLLSRFSENSSVHD